MRQVYSNPSRESDPYALPDVEVFYQDHGHDETGAPMLGEGWYYWYSFPGCLPDSDPIGPFESAEAAKQAAIDDNAE